MADRFKELRCFLAVHRFGNFTKGAAALGMSQPSLSAIMSGLEADLGLPLFDRTTRSVELTAAGAQLVPRAAQIISDLDCALDLMRTTTKLAHGRIKIAALPSVCSGILPKALAEFGGKSPNVEVDFSEVLAGEIAGLVVSGDCDFAIGVAVIGQPDIEFSELYSDEVVVVCREDHRFAGLAWPGLGYVVVFGE